MIKAMLVDDEALAIKMLLKLVDWKSFDIDICATASDGEEAIESFERFRPELIVTDIGMPGMNGLSLIQKVNDISRNTEFILITAHADFKYIQQAMRLGCVDYVLKPIDESELEKVIEKAAGRIRERSGLIVRGEREEAKKKKQILMDYMKTGRKTQPFLALEEERQHSPLRLMSIDITGKDTYEEKNYAGRMLENIFVESGEFLFFDREDEFWTALIWGHDSSLMTMRAEQIAAFVHNDLEETPKICFTGQGEGLQSLPSLYEKLILLRRYSFFLNLGDIRGYGYNCGENNNTLNEFTLLESEMSGAVRSHDRARAIRALDRMIEWSQNIDPALLSSVYEFCHNAVLLAREWYIDVTDCQESAADTANLALPGALCITYVQLASIRTSEGLREAVIRAIDTIKEPESGGTRAAAPHYSNFVLKGMTLLKDRFASNISLDDLCNELAVSKNYFCYLFKKETGKRVWEYLAEIRMEKAKMLLADTNLNIFEIACQVGYDNASYFNKIFKRLNKMTPNEYREGIS